MFIVFDLDDTLANTSHRQHILTEHFDLEYEKWDTFFEACDKDEPIEEVIAILSAFLLTGGHTIEIWTGRSELVREKTNNWLIHNVPGWSLLDLRMRACGDTRHDIEIKSEWVAKYGQPDLVFDDRNQMVKWWREQGIICCQVKESTF